MKTFGKYLEEKNKGLWDNIHAKRKRGEKMRKPGSKGAPTDADFKRSQEESVEAKKYTAPTQAEIDADRKKNQSGKSRPSMSLKSIKNKQYAGMSGDLKKESVEEKKLTAAELKKREEIAKAMERDNPGMDMSKKMAIATATAKRVAEEQKLDEISQKKKDDYVAKASADRQSAWVKKGMADRTKDTKTSDAMKKKMAKRDKGMYRAMGEQNLDITEISLDMLTKKISNSGMTTTKKANKMDKTKDDLAALKARLAGKPAMAKESVELDELSKKTLGSYIKKADKQANKAADSYSNAAMRRSDFAPDTPAMAKNAKKFAKRDAGADLARRKLAKEAYEEMKEAAELDELSKKTLGSYVKKASRDVANRSADNARDYATGNRPVGMNKKAMKNWRREIGIDMAIDKMAKEATELDELNKKTLGSYIKKASGSAAGIAAVTSAQAAIKGKSNPDDRRQLRNRLTGISRATDKVTKEAVMSADKKPEKYVKPDGTVGIRMVRVNKEVIKKDA